MSGPDAFDLPEKVTTRRVQPASPSSRRGSMSIAATRSASQAKPSLSLQ